MKKRNHLHECMANAEAQAQLHRAENTVVFICRGEKWYEMSKLVILGSWSLLSLLLSEQSPILIGYSFVMETDINKEVYAFGWSTGTELKSRYCLCCRRQAEVCQAAGSRWASREAV